MDLLNGLTDKERFLKALELVKADCSVTVVDVRTPDEYKEGHLPGSVNIPLEKLAVADIDEDTHILAYCMSGSRSERAVMWLKERDFCAENIGGIMCYNGELVK